MGTGSLAEQQGSRRYCRRRRRSRARSRATRALARLRPSGWLDPTPSTRGSAVVLVSVQQPSSRR
ncbi:RRXRR domain-containing protein [Streptosporangium sp. 'caverna']|uniref:RRXRR domain-containing protein n=1 Tax=Streptosporangium sp. 'caverna' TaxID=2202249 RepID=UPI003517B63B